MEADGGTGHASLHYLFGLNIPFDPQDTAEGQESIKAKLNVIRSKLEHQVRKKIRLMIQSNLPSFH